MTPDSSRRSPCSTSSRSASSRRMPSGSTSSRSAGSKSAQPGADLVDQPLGPRRARRAGQRLEVGAQPLELEHQRPRVLRVQQHQFGDRGDAHRAEIAPPVDDRRLAGHQRGFGDGLFGAGAADRRQRRPQQCSQRKPPLDSLADVHHRPADVLHHRLGGQPGQREHPGQRLAVRRHQERLTLCLGFRHQAPAMQHRALDRRQHHPGVVGHLVAHRAGGQPEPLDGLGQ